ncbi:glycine hydroxymethyltransferase [Pantoea sp. App145]|uniref:glycine hydroxymethyltransferase n=1 Tax=Pantoea sp. App145 TaxID=3071567 RepID=UPI003A7F69E5
MTVPDTHDFTSSANDPDALLRAAAARTEVLQHDRIVLYAGANLPSPAAMAAYAPGLSAYPAMGPAFDKEQPDTGLVSALEVALTQEINGLLGSTWAETRLPNCTTANLAVFHTFTKPGDLLLAPAAAHGGHLSQRRDGTPALAGLRVTDLPFEVNNCCLDAAAAADQVRLLRPTMVMLGRSVMIKPDDVEPVVAAAREVGAVTVFDASHVLGLITGGVFPNPLALGVDILTSSTYKTLPGRPHSIIAGRDAGQGKQLAQLIGQRFIANADAGCLPSLLVTLREAREEGAHYAQQICRNTLAMAGALAGLGVTVTAATAGQIATHQLLVPMSDDLPPNAVIDRLARQGVLVGTCNDPQVPGKFALRVGTQFMTRQGCDEQAFAAFAARLAGLLTRGPDGRMVCSHRVKP